MPKGKRTPIDYTPQLGGGIFRPKDVVADELAMLRQEEEDTNPDEFVALGQQPTFERTDERSNERMNIRTRVRHSFDIWQDQLLALTEIQARQFSRTGRKPKLGELVQEALDAYIANQRERPNEQTNVRTNKKGRLGSIEKGGYQD
jgi:hypothetical protein